MLQIFFGGYQQRLDPYESGFLETFLEPYSLKQMVFLQQVHGKDGIIVTAHKKAPRPVFGKQQGDFLITNGRRIGIGVLTADCLSVVVYDKVKKTIGVAHAGWRGLVAGVIKSMTEALKTTYQTSVEDLEVFVGPTAKVCCYEVGRDFVEKIQDNQLALASVQEKANKFYFGLVTYLKGELDLLGVRAGSLHFESNHCTICSPGYCSYRAQRGTKNRNITLVSLK